MSGREAAGWPSACFPAYPRSCTCWAPAAPSGEPGFSSTRLGPIEDFAVTAEETAQCDWITEEYGVEPEQSARQEESVCTQAPLFRLQAIAMSSRGIRDGVPEFVGQAIRADHW